jgi:hypothetical protein
LDDQEKSRVKVLDRRHFTSEGQRREADAPERPDPPPPPPPPQEAQAPPPEEGETGPEGPFAEFLLNLSSSAFMSLGQIPNPLTGRPDLDIQSAASIIDILEMLQIKTRGNLTLAERDLLDKSLYQLKMLYVQALKKAEG